MILLTTGQIDSTHILLPPGSGHGRGMIDIYDENFISRQSILKNSLIEGPGNQVIRQSLQNVGFNELQIDQSMEEIKFVAYGPWVDNYLDNTRKGSWGTTLIVVDDNSRAIGFLIAIHSDLFATGGQILGNTLIEESVQGAIYHDFFDKFSNSNLFSPQNPDILGQTREQIILQELTGGNLRAFLEFIQHVAIKSAYNSWTYFPYEIQVGPNGQSTKIVAQSIPDFDNLLSQTAQSLPDSNFPASTDEFLADYSNLAQLDNLFFQVHQVHIWDYFGMAREGLRVFPLQEFRSERQIAYVSPDQTLVNEFYNHQPTFERLPLSQMEPGTQIYIIADSENEIFVKNQAGAYLQIPNLVTKGRVFRTQIIGDGYGEVLPDNGQYRPFGNGFQDIFINLEHYSPVYDYEPITLFETTQNQDKQIIVIQSAHPEVILVEGNQIILRTPVVLGDEGTATPIGDHRLYRTRPSRHMPGQPGVGFASYIGGGNALHESPWWNWANIDQGFYGSHGCMNLPSREWEAISLGVYEMSIAQFVQRWVSTNVGLDVKSQEEGFTNWTDPGYFEGISAVRLLVVSDIRDVQNYHNQGSGDFTQIITNYYSLSESWVLPQY